MTVPSESVPVAPTPTSTPVTGPVFTRGGCSPSSTQKDANQVPAVRLTVTSRMEPGQHSSSTMVTRQRQQLTSNTRPFQQILLSLCCFYTKAKVGCAFTGLG